MAQVARPIADVFNSGWSPTPLFPHVNTVTPNDGSPVATPCPPGGYFIVQLKPLAWPAPGGPEVLTVRLNQLGQDVILASFFLLEQIPGGTVYVAGGSVQPGPAFISYNLVLTPDQIALITDYTKLQVLVLAASPTGGSLSGSPGTGIQPIGGSIVACGCTLPTTVYVTLTGAASGTYELTWQRGTTTWTNNSVFICGVGSGPGSIGLRCSDGTWSMAIAGPCGVPSTLASSVTCLPLEIVFDLTGMEGTCCEGAITATVTE
jgi:hypothetical protein